MKTAFGTRLTRLLRGGVLLSPLESWAVQTLVSSLPQELRLVVEAQFERYVLVQREFDGRALNFYPRRRELRVGLQAPSLKMDLEDAPLIRIKMSVSEPSATLHAVLSAVLGRAFSVSFSQDVRPFAAASSFAVEEVVQSWRSNFSLAEVQQAVARDVRNART